ncbi:MAG: hypothetical protein ACK4HB_06235 [Candidatus Bipolaricaulia bacterium]
MAEKLQTGTLRVFTRRAGTVNEIVGFLQDIEAAHNKIFLFFSFLDLFADSERFSRWRYRWRYFWREFGFPPPFWMPFVGLPGIEFFQAILPEYNL